MLDAILSEKRSIPSAAILTQPFVPTARALSEIQNMPGYPFVVLPHPVTSLTADEARARADAATPYIESLLVEGVARPENDEISIEGAVETSSASDLAKLRKLTEELAEPLRADGADLTVRLSAPKELTFALRTSGATCEECVMPGTHLLEIYRNRTRHVFGKDWTVRLEDPREEQVLH